MSLNVTVEVQSEDLLRHMIQSKDSPPVEVPYAIVRGEPNGLALLGGGGGGGEGGEGGEGGAEHHIQCGELLLAPFHLKTHSVRGGATLAFNRQPTQQAALQQIVKAARSQKMPKEEAILGCPIRIRFDKPQPRPRHQPQPQPEKPDPKNRKTDPSPLGSGSGSWAT